jgi:hypothetical protein
MNEGTVCVADDRETGKQMSVGAVTSLLPATGLFGVVHVSLANDACISEHDPGCGLFIRIISMSVVRLNPLRQRQ